MGWRLAMLCVAAACSQNISAKELKFEQVFYGKGEPGAMHYQVMFAAKGTEHQMEVWRDGNRRIKRRTDETIETYAFRKPDDAEFRLSILDMKKHIHTRIDRANLYRIGNFTDWFDLAHGLKHPMGEYRLVKNSAPGGSSKAIIDCQWYSLTQDGHTNHICWSVQSHLPLVIQTQEGQVVWRIATLDTKPIPEKIFEIHDEGFIHNDANQDIDRD
jgi:hypothetical protein